MTAAQPYLFGPTWIPVRDGNVTAMHLFLRHYTARSARKQFQCVGPGEKMLLLTPDARAFFAWRKFFSDAGEVGINCAVFHNECSSAGRASDLIREADQLAWERWPGERHYTYVDSSKVRRKRDPGRCFLRAGWRKCGVTNAGLLILETLP